MSGANRDDKEAKYRAEGRVEVAGTGEGETLVGKKLAAFGDKVIKEKAPSSLIEEADQGKKRENMKSFDELMGRRQARAGAQLPDLAGPSDDNTHDLKHVNFAALEVEQELLYRPRTKETQVHYDQLMHKVQRHLGDAAIETTRDALDEMLAILKEDNLNDA